jgi:hypothetical protein
MEDDRMVKKLTQLETIWEKASRKTQEQMDRWNPKKYGSSQGEELEEVEWK